MRIVVLLPSDKSVRAPGVSLVESPLHTPGGGGVQVNFHMGEQAMMESTLKTALAQAECSFTRWLTWAMECVM